MLKFNIKEHDLKELEKYGFNICSKDSNNLYLTYISSDGIDSVEFQAQFSASISKKDYEFNLYICTQIEDDYIYEQINRLSTLIYDLIKNDLIIKE